MAVAFYIPPNDGENQSPNHQTQDQSGSQNYSPEAVYQNETTIPSQPQSPNDVNNNLSQNRGRSESQSYSSNGVYQNATTISSNSSSQQQSPNDLNNNQSQNHEQLLQILCEAIYRIGGSPNYQMTPPSPSCSPRYYAGENYFFPRSAPTPRTPRTPIDNRRPPQAEFPRRRPRLSSTGEDDYEQQCASDNEISSSSSNNEEQNDHMNYMAARERLQMFPGRVPPRKKKRKDSQSFAWPTVVTAVVIAVGCGMLVTRN